VVTLDDSPSGDRPSSRRSTLRWVRRGVLLLASFAVLDYFVLPQIAGTKKALYLLRTVNPWWAITAIALEALSLVSYSLLTRTVFPDHRPPFSWLLRIDLTTLGVGHVLPGGTATSTALRYRLLREAGIPAEDAAVGMAVQGIGSNLVLVAILWLALVSSIPVVGVDALYLSTAIVGAVAIAVTPIAMLLYARRTPSTRRPLNALLRRVPKRFRPRTQRALQGAGDQLRQLFADKRSLRESAQWSAGNWFLDAASLWVFLAAYRHLTNPVILLVAYGLANVAAIIPISPGGLGVIEAVLIPSLVGFGTPRAVAVLAVVSWRLFNFWAPIPAAGVSYLSLRTQRWRNRHRIRDGRPAVHQ
jgi:uncharacterized protein (TIRG00374 family)